MNLFHTGLASDMAWEETLPVIWTSLLPLTRILMSPLPKVKLSAERMPISVALVVAGGIVGGAWCGRVPCGRVAVARCVICCTDSGDCEGWDRCNLGYQSVHESCLSREAIRRRADGNFARWALIDQRSIFLDCECG